MGKFLHFNTPVKSPEKLVTFYKDVFNWKITPSEESEFLWKIHNDNQPFVEENLANLMKKNGVKSIIGIIDVDNIDVSLEKVLKNEGEIIIQKVEIPLIGIMAYAKDCEGTVFGLIEKF